MLIHPPTIMKLTGHSNRWVGAARVGSAHAPPGAAGPAKKGKKKRQSTAEPAAALDDQAALGDALVQLQRAYAAATASPDQASAAAEPNGGPTAAREDGLDPHMPPQSPRFALSDDVLQELAHCAVFLLECAPLAQLAHRALAALAARAAYEVLPELIVITTALQQSYQHQHHFLHQLQEPEQQQQQ